MQTPAVSLTTSQSLRSEEGVLALENFKATEKSLTNCLNEPFYFLSYINRKHLNTINHTKGKVQDEQQINLPRENELLQAKGNVKEKLKLLIIIIRHI